MKTVIQITVSFLVAILFTGCTAMKAIKLVNSSEVAAGSKTKSVVPFRVDGHVMLVKVRVNHSKRYYTFILDTGAINMLRKDVAMALGLSRGVEIDAGGTGGNSKKINLATLDSIVVGGMEVKNCATGITDFNSIFPKRIDGILGSSFLKHFKVTINYQTKRVALSQKSNSMPLKKGDIKIPISLDIMMGFAPVAKCRIDGTVSDKCLIDTGFDGFMGIPVSMIKKMPSFHNGSAVASTGGTSFGMFGGASAKEYMMRTNSLKIGNLKIQNIPAKSHAHKDGSILIGQRILENYIVTIDYPREEMILRPVSSHYSTNIDGFGLALNRKDGKTVVMGVWENSSAYKSGLKIGDEIIQIGKVKTKSITNIYDLVELLNDERKKSVTILFRNKSGKHTIVLKRKMLLP